MHELGPLTLPGLLSLRWMPVRCEACGGGEIAQWGESSGSISE